MDSKGTGEQLEREIRQSRGVKVGGKQIGEREGREIPYSEITNFLAFEHLNTNLRQ